MQDCHGRQSKLRVPVGGEPASFLYRWLTETLRSILPRIEEFGLSNADNLQALIRS
jgi:hypothetical protein